MNQAVNFIKNRLSLRNPQTESLEILSEITNLLSLSKTPKTIQENGSLISDLAFLKAEEEKIKSLSSRYSEIKKFSEFERDFPNICFSLATGVGKTRLMGAFIAPVALLGGSIVTRAAWYTAGLVGGLSVVAATAPSEKFLNMTGPLAIGLGGVFAASLGA